MYAPRGFGYPEVGDCEVIPVGDEMHLFHLTLPNHDVVQHAVSDDGLAWRGLPAALRTGEYGECDDDMIWTMSVTEHEGNYFMLYTALSRADDGRIQRTGLATSGDLLHWTKSAGNPVAAPDPRWYESDPDSPAYRRMISWRDPKPIRVGAMYYATLNAREHDGPVLRRGCVGLISSRDMEMWSAQPPLFAPRRWWDLECPQVFTVDGTYYLTAAVMEERTQRYWMADDFMGPYRVPPDGGLLAPQGHYAGRVTRWRGMDLYFCWHTDFDQLYDWAGISNRSGKFVVSPLVLVKRADGSLARRAYPGWDAYHAGPVAGVQPAPASLLHARPTDAWQVVAADGGTDIVATADAATHFTFSGTLTLDAMAGGLGFRLDTDGGGYFVGLTAGSTEATLTKWLPAGDPPAWFRYTVLQRTQLRQPIAAGQPLPFSLRVVGPAIECTLDDDVVFAYLSAERATGPIGIWAESGAARATDVQLTPMRVPEHSSRASLLNRDP